MPQIPHSIISLPLSSPSSPLPFPLSSHSLPLSSFSPSSLESPYFCAHECFDGLFR